MEKTTKFISAEEAEKSRKWHIVDASGLTLGRVASEVAAIIRGKNKVTFTPHNCSGDSVIIVNASKVKVTGNKLEAKMYYKHTGFIGHLQSMSAGEILSSKKPEQLLEFAIWGMLPKGVNGKHMRKQLKVFAGAEGERLEQMKRAQKAVEYKPSCACSCSCSAEKTA